MFKCNHCQKSFALPEYLEHTKNPCTDVGFLETPKTDSNTAAAANSSNVSIGVPTASAADSSHQDGGGGGGGAGMISDADEGDDDDDVELPPDQPPTDDSADAITFLSMTHQQPTPKRRDTSSSSSNNAAGSSSTSGAGATAAAAATSPPAAAAAQGGGGGALFECPFCKQGYKVGEYTDHVRICQVATSGGNKRAASNGNASATDDANSKRARTSGPAQHQQQSNYSPPIVASSTPVATPDYIRQQLHQRTPMNPMANGGPAANPFRNVVGQLGGANYRSGGAQEQQMPGLRGQQIIGGIAGNGAIAGGMAPFHHLLQTPNGPSHGAHHGAKEFDDNMAAAQHQQQPPQPNQAGAGIGEPPIIQQQQNFNIDYNVLANALSAELAQRMQPVFRQLETNIDEVRQRMEIFEASMMMKLSKIETSIKRSGGGGQGGGEA